MVRSWRERLELSPSLCLSTLSTARFSTRRKLQFLLLLGSRRNVNFSSVPALWDIFRLLCKPEHAQPRLATMWTDDWAPRSISSFYLTSCRRTNLQAKCFILQPVFLKKHRSNAFFPRFADVDCCQVIVVRKNCAKIAKHTVERRKPFPNAKSPTKSFDFKVES